MRSPVTSPSYSRYQPSTLVREDMSEEQRAQLVNEAIKVLLGEDS